MIANGQVREPVERVEEAHHPVVEAAADEAGDGAVDDADEEDRERRAERDQDRDAATECHAGEQVATELVRAERMLERGRLVCDREVDLVRIVGRDDRHDQAVEEDEHEDDSRDHGALVVDVAPPGVLPEVRLPDRGSRGGRGAGLDGEPLVAQVGGIRDHPALRPARPGFADRECRRGCRPRGSRRSRSPPGERSSPSRPSSPARSRR